MFNPNEYFIIVETVNGPVMGRVVGKQGIIASVDSDDILVRNHNDWFSNCRYFTRSLQVEHSEDIPLGKMVVLGNLRGFVVKTEEIFDNENSKGFLLTLAR